MKRRGFSVAIIGAITGCLGNGNNKNDTSNSASEIEVQWSYDDAEQNIGKVLTANNAYYLLDGGGNLIKLAKQSGEQLWYTQIGTPSYGPFLAGEFIIFPAESRGRPKYYIFNKDGDQQSQIDSSDFINSYVREHNAVGTSEHLIITIETRSLDGDTNLSAYITDPAEGEIIDSKNWDTFANISASMGNKYIISDSGSIQLVDNSYNKLWNVSTEYDRLQHIAVSDQNEIIVDAIGENSVGIIHLSEDGQIINEEKMRGAPDEEVDFFTDTLTMNGVTILPISINDAGSSILQKYDHNKREITEDNSIDGDLGSMVRYDDDILISIDGGYENIGTEEGTVEFQQRNISDLTRKNYWMYDGSGRFVHGSGNSPTYIEDDSISILELS